MLEGLVLQADRRLIRNVCAVCFILASCVMFLRSCGGHQTEGMAIWKSRKAGNSSVVEKRTVGDFKAMLMDVNNAVVNEM